MLWGFFCLLICFVLIWVFCCCLVVVDFFLMEEDNSISHIFFF